MSCQARKFIELAQRLHAQEDLATMLQEVADSAAQSIRCDRAGVMLVGRRRAVEMVATSDDIVSKADALQIEFDEGPCLDAAEDQSVYVIADTCTDPRWERWCRSVAEIGIRSVLSLRLSTRKGVRGALNLYASTPDRFDRSAIEHAMLYADHASIALSSAYTESGLREAMDGRHVIGLAQGILMARFDLSVEQSFSVLRRYSQDRNIKLRDVAAHVVESRTLPD